MRVRGEAVDDVVQEMMDRVLGCHPEVRRPLPIQGVALRDRDKQVRGLPAGGGGRRNSASLEDVGDIVDTQRPYEPGG